MKKITLLISIILTSVLFLTSCNKEGNFKEELVNNDILSPAKVPYYADDSELRKALDEVLSLNQKERTAKATKQGFKSFGTITQEFYETIDPDQFQSLEEIKAFVAQHSEYIQLITEENGEYTLEIIAFNNPYRHLANENREIKVGQNIYKVTEESLNDVETGEAFVFSPMEKTNGAENILIPICR